MRLGIQGRLARVWSRRILVTPMCVLVWLSLAGKGFASFPPPISERELTRWSAWTAMSPNQIEVVKQFHVEYRERFEADLSPRLRGYFDEQVRLIQEVNEGGGNRSARALDLYAPLHQKRSELRREIDELDAWLFQQCSSLFDDESVGRRWLERVTSARERQRLRPANLSVPESQVDLIETLDRIDLTDVEVLEHFRQAYERRYIEALRAMEFAAVREWKELTTIQSLQYQLDYETDSADRMRLDALSRDIQNRYRKWRSDRFARIDRLIRTNREGLAMLRGLLENEDFRLVEEEYYETAYPEIERDPASAEHLYDQIVAMDWPEDVLAAIESHRVSFVRRYDELTKRLRDLRFQIVSERMASSPLDHIEHARLTDQYERIGLERESLSAEQIDRIRSVVPGDRHHELPKWEFERTPPERPWRYGI